MIDDEVQIRKLLRITLESQGYTVAESATGEEGVILAANHPPDLVILDLGLPDMSGHVVLKQLRDWYSNPIIILSVQSDEEDIVRALDSGANDYLVKPFRTGELLARMRTAQRRTVPDSMEPVVVVGSVAVDLAMRTVRKSGELVKLTTTEYALLALLARNEGRVLTHQYLLREVWGPEFVGQTQYLRVFVAQLRKKIEEDPNRPVWLVTESGVGYRLRGGE